MFLSLSEVKVFVIGGCFREIESFMYDRALPIIVVLQYIWVQVLKGLSILLIGSVNWSTTKRQSKKSII